MINTLTTIVTFLMVSSSRTRRTATPKPCTSLDELIRAIKEAQNSLLDLENLDEEELDRIRSRYERLAEEARGTTCGNHRQETDDRGTMSDAKDKKDTTFNIVHGIFPVGHFVISLLFIARALGLIGFAAAQLWEGCSPAAI